jgi:hypothetical protein
MAYKQNEVICVQCSSVGDAPQAKRLQERPALSALDQSMQHFHNEEEYHRGYQPPLVKIVGMANPVTRAAVEQDLGTRRRQQGGHPIPPSQCETHVLENVNQEWSGDQIEGAGDVNLEQQTGTSSSVHQSHRRVHETEVIMDASTLDEGVLVWVHKLTELRGQLTYQHLRK